MKYTKEQLICALCREYDYLCHDDFDAETDDTPEEWVVDRYHHRCRPTCTSSNEPASDLQKEH